MEKTLGEVIQLTKLNELMKKTEKNEKVGKIVKIVLICTGAFALLAGVGFLVFLYGCLNLILYLHQIMSRNQNVLI